MRENLDKKLIETYEVRKKDSLDIIPRWEKEDSLKEPISSLKELNDYFCL